MKYALINAWFQLSKTALEQLSIHLSVHSSFPAANFLFVIQGEKRQPYDEDIRVPLIVRGPGVPNNMTTDALALNIDLVRTAQQGLVSSS